MIDRESLHRIGTFGKPVGYKGAVCLHSDCDIETDTFVFLMMDGLPVPFRIREVRPKGEDFVVFIKGITDDKAASALYGKDAFSDAPAADEDNDGIVYLSDLGGYRLFNGDNELGNISFVDDSTENVLLYVKAGNGKEIIIPAADDFMVEVDPQNKILTMDLPEGLINLND